MALAVLAFVTLAAAAQPQPNPAVQPQTRPGAVAPQATPGAPALPAKADGPYRVLRSFDVGGEGGWDIVTVDAGRLYVPRGSHVMVIDTESGKVVGDKLP